MNASDIGQLDGTRRATLKALGTGAMAIPAAALAAGKLSLAPAAFDADSSSVMIWASATEALKAKVQWRVAAADDAGNAKAGYREFMAGPIGSFVHYQHAPSARDRYEKAGSFHYGDGPNFGLIEVDPQSGKGWVEWRGLKGVVLGRVEI